MQKVAEASSTTTTDVVNVAQYLGQQFRHLPQAQANGKLLAVLVLTAQEYGARHEMAPHMAKECALLFAKKFAHMAIDEIKEAYRQWAAGEINPKGAEMYGGTFNAAQFGKVLTAYEERRRSIVAALTNAIAEESMQQLEAERKVQMQQQFNEQFPRHFAKVKAEAKGWQDVPGHFFDILWRRNLLKYSDGEIQKIRQAATAIAEKELAETKRTAGQFAALPSLESRVRSIGGKMLVWEKAIKNEDFELTGFETTEQ